MPTSPVEPAWATGLRQWVARHYPGRRLVIEPGHDAVWVVTDWKIGRDRPVVARPLLRSEADLIPYVVTAQRTNAPVVAVVRDAQCELAYVAVTARGASLVRPESLRQPTRPDPTKLLRTPAKRAGRPPQPPRPTTPPAGKPQRGKGSSGSSPKGSSGR
jgi:hypothetical protein